MALCKQWCGACYELKRGRSAGHKKGPSKKHPRVQKVVRRWRPNVGRVPRGPGGITSMTPGCHDIPASSDSSETPSSRRVTPAFLGLCWSRWMIWLSRQSCRTGRSASAAGSLPRTSRRCSTPWSWLLEERETGGSTSGW